MTTEFPKSEAEVRIVPSSQTSGGVIYASEYFQTEQAPHISNKDLSLRQVIEEINDMRKRDGAKEIICLGDGSSQDIDNLVKDLPYVQFASVGDQDSRMFTVWKESEPNSTNYIPEPQLWLLGGRVDAIVVDSTNMEPLTSEKVNLLAKQLLKIGGVMYVQVEKSWSKRMKQRDGELLVIPYSNESEASSLDNKLLPQAA